MVIAVILLPPIIATLLLLLLNAPFILELFPQPPSLSNGTSTATLPTALRPPAPPSCPTHSSAWPYAGARAAALIALSAAWLSWVVHGFAELCGRAVEFELEEDAELRHARVARRRVAGC